MKIDNAAHVEKLKAQVLLQIGIQEPRLLDMPELQAAIENKTGLHLSLVTLNRSFDLMTHRFPPSNFTLHVFALFCGCRDWGNSSDVGEYLPAC